MELEILNSSPGRIGVHASDCLLFLQHCLDRVRQKSIAYGATAHDLANSLEKSRFLPYGVQRPNARMSGVPLHLDAVQLQHGPISRRAATIVSFCQCKVGNFDATSL